jgi:DNA polymerase III sliding clamp (beta) subunit (PCNA family)
MIIKKANLQQALEIVKPGLANKEIVEQATSFAFMEGRVVTYNDEISISHKVDGLDITGAVKADKLYPLLAKIKKEEIDLEIVKNEIIISSGRMKAGIFLQQEITLPLDQGVAEKGKWKNLPANFTKSLEFAMGSCAKDMSKGVLTCVHIDKRGFIEGSDIYCLAKCDLKTELPIESTLIPASSAVQVVRVNPTKVASGNGWIHFRNNAGTIISCRTWEDVYPDSAKMDMIKGARLILPKVDDALDRAAIFSKMDHILDEEVVINISDNRFKMRATSDDGWFEEELNMKYSGAPIELAITPYLLRGILGETKACQYTENKLKFEGEGWFYITALRNIKPKKK